jgi:hypothetical protein
VSRPDIANGYFLHPLRAVAADPEPSAVRRPDQIGAPFTEPVDIVVFGSNGGVPRTRSLPLRGRPVYQLQDAGYTAGVHEAVNEHSITTVGNDLDFIQRLLTAREAFAEGDHVIGP